MKGVKRRFFNIRNIALFISIFMVISLFSNITVKADELENGEVISVVSEEAEIENSQQCDTENELLIPGEETEQLNAQMDEAIITDEMQDEDKEIKDESKEEVSTAEETEKQDEVIDNQEPVNNEDINGEEGTTTDETIKDEEKQEDESLITKEKLEVGISVNGAVINNEEEVKLNEGDEICLDINYDTRATIKSGDTLSFKIPSFIEIEELKYSDFDFSDKYVADDGTVILTFNERIIDEISRYRGNIELNGKIGTIEGEEESEVVNLVTNETLLYSITIKAMAKINPDPKPQEPEEEAFKGSVELTKVEKGNRDKVLSGVKFILLNENLDKIGDVYTTDEQGKIVVNDLVEGNYYFIEIAPKAGYVLDMIPVKFTISKDNKDMVSVIKENALLPKITFPTIDKGNGSTTSKLSGLGMASKLSTNTSTNYRKTLPNTGGNSKAVVLVIAFAAVLVGFKFVRRNKDNNIT